MEAEVMSGNAGEQLVMQGAALMRIENESMLKIAVQRPRDESEVIKRAIRELEIAPENAKAAYYSIPYRERQQDGSYRVVKVEGGSIKAAMSLARRWGNCTVAARTMNEDDGGWDLEGVFVDFETNFRVCRPFRVSKFLKTKKAGVVKLDSQRELMTLQAGASKAIRNATLAGLPDYLVSAYIAKAREIVGGKLDQPASRETIAAVLRAFAKIDVTQEQLERYSKLALDLWTGTEIADLRGLWNAIQDGQVTAEEAFAVAAEADPIAKPLRASEVNGNSANNGENEGAATTESPVESPAPSDAEPALRVASVNVKTGESKKTGKSWTLYEVTFSDDRVATTFSHTLGQKATAAQAAGTPVRVELAPGAKGLEISVLDFVEPGAEGGEA
jgi:hypothetical protein